MSEVYVYALYEPTERPVTADLWPLIVELQEGERILNAERIGNGIRAWVEGTRATYVARFQPKEDLAS